MGLVIGPPETCPEESIFTFTEEAVQQAGSTRPGVYRVKGFRVIGNEPLSKLLKEGLCRGFYRGLL